MRLPVSEEQSKTPPSESTFEEDSSELIAIIDVPDIIGIAESCTLKEDLLDKLPHAKEIHVPLEHVKKVTTTFIQTMIVASKQAKNQNTPLKWGSPSKVIVDAFSDLGLYNQLTSMEFN
jgi:hypothetical protein